MSKRRKNVFLCSKNNGIDKHVHEIVLVCFFTLHSLPLIVRVCMRLLCGSVGVQFVLAGACWNSTQSKSIHASSDQFHVFKKNFLRVFEPRPSLWVSGANEQSQMEYFSGRARSCQKKEPIQASRKSAVEKKVPHSSYGCQELIQRFVLCSCRLL